MMNNAKAAEAAAEDLDDADEAAFDADAEDELRAAEDDPASEEALEDEADPVSDDAPEDADMAEDEGGPTEDEAFEEDMDLPEDAPEDRDMTAEEAEPEAEDDAPDDADPMPQDALDDAPDAAEDAPELTEEAEDEALDEAPDLQDDAPEDDPAEVDMAEPDAPEDPADDADAAEDLAPPEDIDLAEEVEDAADAPEDHASDGSDQWRAGAAQLRGAGLASHVISLSGDAAADEALALDPLLDFAEGALFRLGAGRFAAMFADPDAAAAAAGPDISLSPIEDAREQDAPAPDAIALVAPFAAAAMRAGGPRVVIDAEFALDVASRAAQGVRGIVAAAETARDAAWTESLARLEDRLAGAEAALDAILAAVTRDRPASAAPAAMPEGDAGAFEARLAARIDASVDRAVAAVRADVMKSARARRDADRRALEPALQRLGEVAEALEQDRRVAAGRSDAYAESIRAIVGELVLRAPAPGKSS